MVNQSEIAQTAIKGLNITLFILVLWVLIYYIHHAWLQYKRGALYDLEQREKSEAKRLASLSDKELIKEANDGLGIKNDK